MLSLTTWRYKDRTEIKLKLREMMTTAGESMYCKKDCIPFLSCSLIGKNFLPEPSTCICEQVINIGSPDSQNEIKSCSKMT